MTSSEYIARYQAQSFREQMMSNHSQIGSFQAQMQTAPPVVPEPMVRPPIPELGELMLVLEKGDASMAAGFIKVPEKPKRETKYMEPSGRRMARVWLDPPAGGGSISIPLSIL